MQIKPAPVSCYRKLSVDETEDPKALRRLAPLSKVEVMCAVGTLLAVALEAVEVTRRPFYLWRVGATRWRRAPARLVRRPRLVR